MISEWQHVVFAGLHVPAVAGAEVNELIAFAVLRDFPPQACGQRMFHDLDQNELRNIFCLYEACTEIYKVCSQTVLALRALAPNNFRTSVAEFVRADRRAELKWLNWARPRDVFS